MKENNIEEIFANIDCVDFGGDKHKIRMKVDTGANRNIIPLRIYKKIYPRDVSNKIGKPTAITREVITLWAVNDMKISQYGSIILKIKHKDSPTIQATFYICENDTVILGLRPSIQLGLVQITCSVTKKDTKDRKHRGPGKRVL